jgi:hypothetical protein
MVNKLKKVFAWLYTSENAQNIILISEVILGVTGVFYTINSDKHYISPDWDIYLIVIVSVVFSMLFIYGIGGFIFRRKFGLNTLVYDPDKGILFDKKLDNINVALRVKTFSKLLEGFLKTGDNNFCEARVESLVKVAKCIGSEFAREFLDRPNHADLGDKEALELILEYDSSSGMGGFSLKNFPKPGDNRFIIEIKRPLKDSGDSNNVKAKYGFLAGYLNGIVNEIFKDNYNFEIKSIGREKIQVVFSKCKK